MMDGFLMKILIFVYTVTMSLAEPVNVLLSPEVVDFDALQLLQSSALAQGKRHQVSSGGQETDEETDEELSQLMKHPRAREPANAPPDVMDAQGVNKLEYHDLQFTNILHNNLGGLGPDNNAPVGIRYGRATTLNGKNIDLLITANNYNSAMSHKNGLNGLLGVVNILNGHSVNFRAQFLEEGTDTPVTMGKFYLSFFDIDSGRRGGQEKLTISGFDKHFVLDNTELEVQLGQDGATFAAGKHGIEIDNPDDPLMLTDMAAARTATFQFPAGLSEINFSYSVASNADSSDTEGRHFLLAGMSSLYFCQAHKVNIDFSFAKVVHSNLGNQGPDFGQPEGLRFGKIAALGDGKYIDMIINAVGPYTVANSERNGLRGQFGQVNIKSDASTKFAFRFLEPDSDVPATVDWIYFSIYDLDEGKGKKWKETFDIQGFSTHYLTEMTHIKVRELGGGRYQYSSTRKGTGKDNPKDPLKLDQKQKNRAVTFLFHRSSGFNATFSVGNPGNSGRNFLFAGKSSTVFC